MRTYTRKRLEYKVIDGVHEKCRLCLEKVKETVPIFSDNVCASLTMRIMMCVGLEITREDCLPDMICTECHKELNNYYEFKKRCVLTYQKLKSHVLAVKQLETKNNMAKNNVTKVNQEQCELTTENRLSSYAVPFLNKSECQPIGGNTGLNGLPDDHNGVVLEKLSSDPCPTKLDSIFHHDMSEFISSVLLELGVLSRDGEEVLLADQNVNLIEIETGDNHTLVVEMIEASEDKQNTTSNSIITTEANAEPIVQFVEACESDKNVLQTKKDARPSCATCGKQLSSRGALRRHARVHSGERPFACAVCRRAFAQREVLRRHELVHREERPFKCGACARSFTQRGALAAHSRSHAAAGARPLALHRCKRCPKVFLHASGLSRHAMVHSGRVYACAQCGRRFSDKSSLLRHLRAKHPSAVVASTL